MLESLEGRRGEVRARPPIPAVKGLWGRPTAVNNVLTLCAVPMILADGGAAYASLGTGRSRGTQVFQLAGNVRQGGIVELPFGVSLRELVEEYGGGTLSGRPVRAAQVGGPLGAYVPATGFDVAMDYEALAESGAMLGHGGIVVFDETVDMARMARFAMEFCAIESCGKCTPCRVGSTRGVETIDRIIAGQAVGADLVLLDDLCETMTKGSLCAMGGLTPDARAERAAALPRGLRAPGDPARKPSRAEQPDDPPRQAERRRPRGRLRHPGGPRRRDRVGHHRRPRGRRTGRHVGAARGHRGRRRHPQAVRDRLPQGLRVVPDVPGRGRRGQGRARLLHDAVHRRHGRQHPDRDGARPPPQRHGALPLRPPRGLRRLRPRQLRDPGDGDHGRLRRGPLRPARLPRPGRPPAARST